MAAGGAATPAPWWELEMPATPDTTEAVTNHLWELGALGVVEEALPGDERSRLRAFFPATVDPAELLAGVGRYVEALTALGFVAGGAPRIAPLADGDWAAAWREHFRPVLVGRRLVVVPPWSTVPAGERLAIVIEPARAFGTGHHGSTAGCLMALERLLDREVPPYAVDLGAGSGILAIAAARLGVPQVLAVDEDPDAVAAAMANAARNRVCDRVRCVLADAALVPADAAPLVVANLLSAAHRRLAPRYTALVAEGGALVLGGILADEAAAVRDSVTATGFDDDDEISLDGWTTLVLRRRDHTGGAARDATVHVRA